MKITVEELHQATAKYVRLAAQLSIEVEDSCRLLAVYSQLGALPRQLAAVLSWRGIHPSARCRSSRLIPPISSQQIVMTDEFILTPLIC